VRGTTINLSLSQCAAAALDSLPSRTKATFTSTAIVSLHDLLTQSIEILTHETHKRQSEVIAFSRHCSTAFAGNILSVMVFDRARIHALKTAHRAELPEDLLDVAMVLAAVLQGSPKAFAGMLDPMMVEGAG
jgi:hypothetical protein